MICINSHQFAKTHVLMSIAALGLVVSTAIPALAGSFSNTGSMNTARLYHTATLLANGEVLVAGGENYTDGYLDSAELYNPATGKWTLTGTMTTKRWGPQAVLLENGQVLVAGGGNDNTCCGNPDLASAELYNPSTGKWTATGSMATGRIAFIMILLPSGQVLAAGGNAGNQNLSSAELYNPATGTWTATGSMTFAFQPSAAVLLPNGQVFVPAIANLYNPATGTWTAKAEDPVGANALVALLPNGDVFAVGGIQGDSVYNPSANQWTTFAPPPCTISNKQSCQGGVALLSTGQVLVAGGITEVPGSPYPKAETNGLAFLLDPSTLTWTSTASMKESRVGETVTVLLNGQVLFAGGQTFDKGRGALTPIAGAELYKP